MNVWEEFNRFLVASELVSKGVTTARVVIDRVVFEEARNPQTKKEERVHVLYFRGKERGMVLKKTNANRIAELLGESETDNWAGKAVQLIITEAYRPDMNGVGPVMRFGAAAPAKPKTAKEQATEALAAPRKVVASDGELFPDEEDIEAYPVKLATTPVQADAPLLEMALLPTTKQARSATNGSGLSCTITERIIPKWLGHIKSTARRCTWTPSQRIAVRSGRCASR